MNTSGDAAEQIVRMSLEAGEAALKISGAGAQHLVVLLYAVLKEQKKTRGRARMETMVRSGKPLTVFSVKKGDLREFVKEAKRYGILYCAIQSPKGKSDGLVDIMVKEEDAPRINRIVERFREDYTIIVTADHGGHGRNHGSDDREDMLIPVICLGPDFPAGRALEDVGICDIAPTIAGLAEVSAAPEWEGKNLITS